ncbi:MAG: DUF885 family protein [Lysobacteraceae bacterium]
MLCCALAVVTATAASATPTSTSADSRFKALSTAEWNWRVHEQLAWDDSAPIQAALPSVDPVTQAAHLAYWLDVRHQLDTIPAAALSPSARIDEEVYRQQIDVLIAQQQFREYEKPLTSDEAFWSSFSDASSLPLKTEADYRAFISQLRDASRYFDQQIANMHAGLARGFTPPQVTLAGRDRSIAAIADATDPATTSFYQPYAKLPANIPASVQTELRDTAKTAIARDVIPSYRKLLQFMREDYIPHARTALAAESMPDGKAYYQSLIKEYTTLDLTPAQIHDIGLAQVKLLQAQMEVVRRQTGFTDDMPAFLHFLRTDPQFYAKTPEQLLQQAAWISKQVDNIIGKWIGHLPRRRFGIEPVPASIAPYYTSGRAGNGVYLVNTYNLSSRPLYSLRALTLHESAPGHLLQIPLADENSNQPDFRRKNYISAYGEGWALYCEKLGVEMGIYETPYDTFGMLSYQMWRAARLVVDTGIHSQGWTRDRARAYLHDNTALSDPEIDNEVDRYISWPGQALSYYLGELAIVAAREKAEKALGQKFNIRAFHDAVLELGSVPLPVLTAHIDRLIEAGGKGPYPDEE